MSNEPGISPRGKLIIQALNLTSPLNLEVELSASEGFVLGRSDVRSTYVPDIDLATFRALEKGVSRRHAAFVHYQGKLHVIDLSSVNGTFLNGKKLKPELPYIVNDGDHLGLGDLALRLKVAEK